MYQSQRGLKVFFRDEILNALIAVDYANADLANAGMFTNLLGQAMTIPNWSSMSMPSFGGGYGASGYTAVPRTIGAGGVGGYGLGMFSAFGM